MMYLVNQKRKQTKRKKKIVKIKKKVDYEIIEEPNTLLTDMFCQFSPLRPKLRVQEQREDPSHPPTNRHGEHWAVYAT